MEKPTLDPEEWVVSLNDVKRLYISMWRRLIKWAFLAGVATFLYFGNSHVKYRAEASFKEGMERSHSENLFKELLGEITVPNQPQAASFMKSYQVLKPLVEKMGLQITPSPSEWALMRMLRRYRETWKAEKGLPVADLDPFIFQDIRYDGAQKNFFYLLFSDPEQFSVYDKKKSEIGRGKLTSPVCFKEVQFTLKKAPKNLKIGSFYSFDIHSWASTADSLRKRIQIKNDKDNQSVIHISITDRDRYFAAELINELMCQYQAYLKREHDHIAKMQLAYLEGKQEQIFEKMENLFDEHTAYLSHNLEKNGFIGLEQETQSLLHPYQQMHAKILSIDFELSRLNKIEKEGKAVAIAEEGPFSVGLNQITQKIHDLTHQRDLIELSLCQVTEGYTNKPKNWKFDKEALQNSYLKRVSITESKTDSSDCFCMSLQARREELKEIRNQRFALETLIQEVELGTEISSLELNEGLCQWGAALNDLEEREDFAEYLENYARILSMREKMLQERVFYGNQSPSELDGIDLASARGLFLEYNAKLDSAEAAMRHYGQLKKEIPNPQFDLASLSSVLRDPLCQKILINASELGLQLKDEKHHSAKEAARWKEEISLHRKILMDHLDQLYQVEELNVDLIRGKMGALQRLTLDCINRQISALHEQANDAVKERRQALLHEKEILEKKMEDIRKSLAAMLPEKWRFEKWLNIKTSMVNKVMETVTEVVESKTIATHLHHVESKPLDPATLPEAPQSPHLYRMACLGAFAVPFFLFSFALIRGLLKGFPTSLEKLKTFRLPVLGSISTFCDGPAVETPIGPDLDLLRNMALFSEGGKVIGLIGGKGPDYSYALGENFARRQAKSIIVRCDFLSKFRKEDVPGILQIWKSEIGELPIRKGKGFDFILSGGYTPFGTEIVQSVQFKQLVELLKKNYDWVFLLFRMPLSSAESLAALRICDKAIVTVSGEQIEELTPFIDWGYDEDNCRLRFITCI